MTYFVRLVNATGVVDAWGDIPYAQFPLQARDGMTLLECGPDTVQKTVANGATVITVDLVWLQQALRAKVDAEAEMFCKGFVTPGETQMVRYQRKEAQARAWLADNNASVPMLVAEAAATGVTVAALAAIVVATADAWGAIMDMVEGVRIGAKKEVTDATTVPEALAASLVDWQALVP